MTKRMSFVFCILSLVIVVSHQPKTLVHAATPLVAKASTPTPVAMPKEEVTPTPVLYILPYPGILPDHPLYVLKRFRDWILDKLIVDPLRKSEFNILQADKRLGMGAALIDKGNAVLGEEVISKGEKYLIAALDLLKSQKAGGVGIPGYVLEHLEKASRKHEQVLTEVLARTPEAQKSGISGSLDLVKGVLSEIDSLK